jgi:hypothetical protein
VLSYRVMLDVPFQLAAFVSGLLAEHRREIGTRAGTRALTCFRQAVFALAFKHLCTITGLPADQVSQHIDAAFALWRRRSAIAWELDLSILVRADVAVTKPPSATERADLPSKFFAASDAVNV